MSISNAKSCQNGFTVIELLICLSILGILFGLGVPSFSHYLANVRLTAATNELVRLINTARMSAVTHGTHAVLCPSTDGRSCLNSTRWENGTAVFFDSNGNRQIDNGEHLIAFSKELGQKDVKIQSSAGRRWIVYQVDGSSGGSNVSFNICDSRHPDKTRQVVVNNIGRVRSALIKNPSAACPAT